MIDRSVDGYGDVGTTSLSLLARARAADQAAWTRLVKLSGPLVYRWCLRSGVRAEDAADIGQEVFAAVARGLQNFHRDRPGDSFRGWLFTITRNKIRDWAKGMVEVGRGGSDPSPLDRLAAEPCPEEDGSSVWDDRRELVHRAIEMVRGEFESKTWEAFWRTTVDGRSPEAVAEELGMTRAAVYIARGRVRRRLEAEFGELVEFEPDLPGAAEG